MTTPKLVMAFREIITVYREDVAKHVSILCAQSCALKHLTL
jgi:hypothetical protein